MWMLSSPFGDEVVPKGEETQQKVEESPHTKSDSTNDGLEAGEKKKELQALDIEEKKEPEAKPDIEKHVADVQVDYEEKETEVPNNNWETQVKESQEEKEKVEGEEQNSDEEVGSQEEPKKEDVAKKAESEGKSNSDEWTLCDSEGATDYNACLDNKEVIKKLPSTKHYEHHERHCPSSPPTCLVPLPQGYHRPVPWPKS
ncbi:hypothetical protein L7F22_066895 [Adiantum nelumboides]|nr:hypothetical protein [Adiantum nelumboides]